MVLFSRETPEDAYSEDTHYYTVAVQSQKDAQVRPRTGSDAVDAILYAAHRIRTSADAALREHGLSLPGLKLLTALASGDRSMREISQVLHVAPRTVTDMIDTLEGRGLVARCAHATDRRITLLRLTEAGARELATASTASERVAATAISALDEDEQRALQSLLERVCVRAGQPVR
jgi:DNA-binding MarR family transcriptional regulator